MGVSNDLVLSSVGESNNACFIRFLEQRKPYVVPILIMQTIGSVWCFFPVLF